MKKRLFSILICFIMIGLLPTTVFAASQSETVGITITKQWNDQGYEDKRPDSIQGALYARIGNKEFKYSDIILTAAEDWKLEITDLPAMKDGQPITYTVKEDTIADYTASYTAPTAGGLTVGDWSEKITPASQKSWTVSGNIIVANKGGDYYIWTLDTLTDALKADVISAVNAANLQGLGKELNLSNTEFADGESASFEGGKINISNVNNIEILTFEETRAWSLFYMGTLSITEPTGWIITNTYKDSPVEISVEIPFEKKVTLGGDIAPGSETFTLEIFDIGSGNIDEYADVECTAAVTTNGAGTFSGTLKLTGSASQIDRMTCEGFFVREVKGSAANWKYSDAVYYILPDYNGDAGNGFVVYPTTEETDGNEKFYVVANEPVDKMSFENIYTENKSVKPEDPENPTESLKTGDSSNLDKPAKPADSESPKTGDSSNLALWFALLAVSATGVAGLGVYGKKKSHQEK